MRTLSAVAIAVTLVSLSVLAAPVAVTFQVNDSYVKDKVLPGVAVGVAAPGGTGYLASGTTGADGRLVLSLEPGQYEVTYRLSGYVPVAHSPMDVGPSSQTVTTTLTMMMEAAGLTGRERIQVVLNWGSDQENHVKDADSHLVCECGKPGGHVFFQYKLHQGEAHKIDLDVDDTDWGGPETVTILDPKPGEYVYWVHDYTGGPAKLGGSEVVVRVIFGDKAAGEFRVPKRVVSRAWRPFRAIAVDALGQPALIPFTEAELAAGDDTRPLPDSAIPPDSTETSESSSSAAGGSAGEGCAGSLGTAVFVALVVLLVLVAVLIKARKRPGGKG